MFSWNKVVAFKVPARILLSPLHHLSFARPIQYQLKISPFISSPSRLFLAKSFSSTPSKKEEDEEEEEGPVYSKADEVELPMEKLEFQFARSSGPGGQNVNKVNTKAEIRFHVMDADWLTMDVKNRLAEYNVNRINKEGYLIVTSQEHRSQTHNKEDCIKKIKEIVYEASFTPKERAMWEGIGEIGKKIRRQEKKKNSEKKASRSVKHSKDYW